MKALPTLEVVLEQAQARGLPLPIWKWPPLKPYNGFTHDQRVKVWQAVKLVIELGLMPQPSTLACEICQTRQNLCYHSEDYSVLAPHVVCQRCHRLIHQRYKMPEVWEGHVTRYQTPDCWFSGLGTSR